MKAFVENHQEPTTSMKLSFIFLLKRHSLIIGTLLMFLYTWTIDLSNSGVMPFKVPFVVGLTVGWGFIFVSGFMTWLTLGKDATATLFTQISYRDVMVKELGVMDQTAIALCRENNLPVIVLNINTPGAIARAVRGEQIGTIVQ